MNRYTIPMGRILGIPVGLDPSWFLAFALITWTLATSYFPAEFKDWSTAQYWIVGAATSTLLFVSVLLHELGHSVLALHYKVRVRGITLLIFGGIAQVTARPPGAGAEFWIAVAGPGVSLALAGLFYLLKYALATVTPLLALVRYLAFINGSLAFFNLIPGFPLDGGRVLRAIIWGITRNLRRATLIAAFVGRVVASLFIAMGLWQMFISSFSNGLWTTFIGWLLQGAAVAQIRQQRIQGLAAGHCASELMGRGYASISADTTLQQLAERHALATDRKRFVVKRGDKAVGLLTLHHVKEVSQAEWPTTTVAQAMTPVTRMKPVRPDVELWTALEEMDRDQVNQLSVMADDQCLGILSREDILSFMRTICKRGV